MLQILFTIYVTIGFLLYLLFLYLENTPFATKSDLTEEEKRSLWTVLMFTFVWFPALVLVLLESEDKK